MKKYFIILSNQQSGPFTIDELQERNIDSSTPIWHEGLTEWTTASNLQELSSIISTTPPPFKTNNKKTLINNKRLIKISLSFLLLLGIVIGGFTFYKKMERNKNYNLALDLIKNYDSLDIEAFKELSSQNHGKAAYFYAKHLMNNKDSITANKYFEIAAKNGEPFYSQYGIAANSGGEYYTNWVKNNIKLITSVANDGDWYMQFKLCNIYEKGNGVEKNSDSAFKYCKLSSESNYVSALWFLSNYHYYGYGVNKDEKKAFTIMKSLADRGYLPAIGDLGYFYSKGIGTSVNFNEAINYYKIGVSRGDARCQFNLGGQYYNGEGVKKDIKIAIKFLELAANQGFANASNLLQAIKNSQNETSYQQPSSNSRANSEIYTCRYCNSRFTGNGYGYRPDNGTVGIGAEGIGENQIAMFGFCKHGDFCSRKCASEAFINNIRQSIF